MENQQVDQQVSKVDNNHKAFVIKEVLHESWKKLTSHFWFFVLFTLGWTILTAVLDKTGNVMGPIDFISSLLSTLVNFFGMFTLIRFALLMQKGTKPAWKDILEFDGKSFGFYILGALMFSVLNIVGFVLLIIPGIIVIVRLGMFAFIMIEENIQPVQSLKKSWAITAKHFWPLLGFTAVICLINFLGTIAFFIGLMITIPLSALATAHVYEKIKTSV